MAEIELPPSPYDHHLGTEWISFDPDRARLRLKLEDFHRQPMGIMHGGVMAGMIESLCSSATAKAVIPERRIAMGQSLSINLLRPVSAGGIEIEAVAVHRGRMTWVWRAEVKDFEGRTCAIGQMTMAVRQAPEGADLDSLVKR